MPDVKNPIIANWRIDGCCIWHESIFRSHIAE